MYFYNETANMVCACADQAMYQAKAQGRGRVCAWRALVTA